MRDAWDVLSMRNEFSHSMDLGLISFCIMKNSLDDPNQNPKLGSTTIGW